MKTRLFLAGLAIAAMASCTVESPETAPQQPDTCKVFRATIGEDDTRTTLDVGTSSASVIWNAGDKITVLGILSNGGSYREQFSTSTGGANYTEFACYNWRPSSSVVRYLACYPAEQFDATAYYEPLGGFLLGVSIPPQQQAVKGGVAPELLFSIADQHNAMSSELKFKNIMSLVRFRLTGRSASKVNTVKMTLSQDICGSGIYVVGDSESDSYFTFVGTVGNAPYPDSPTVELKGPFEAGEDYFIAIAPCTTSGLTLNFIDDAGNILTRSSSKQIEFRRSAIADLGTIVLDEEFGAPSDKLVKYMEASAGAKPVLLAVSGDGFTAGQQDLFLSLAKSAVDKLFATEPYKTYKDYFTVYLLPVVSNESGASVTDGAGNITTPVDTYFKTRWGSDSYGDMAADNDLVYSYVTATLPELVLGTHDINEVSTALIINDARYGGICHMSSLGACVALVPYSYNGGGIQWPIPGTRAASDSDVSAGVRATTQAEQEAVGCTIGDWRNTFIHEFGGHGIGRLTDEYWDNTYSTSTVISSHSWPVPMGLNVSAVYDDVPWKADLLDNMDRLSTLDSRYPDRIGRFQGGGGYILYRWRSEEISCMIDNRPYYSAWQRILIVKRIKDLAGETFSLDDFLAKDVTRDPVRESSSSSGSRLGTHIGPVRLAPPLAPPVLYED
ncbi:MAG: hypothetical protein K6E37_00940 [Bacteroidales bacterium]|nr:hypothetical protein [Bacteroidales bacterium]